MPASQPTDDTVGTQIMALRKRRGYACQEDLAEALSVAPDTVGRWERDVTYPRGQVLKRFVEKLQPDQGLFDQMGIARRNRSISSVPPALVALPVETGEAPSGGPEELLRALVTAITAGAVSEGNLIEVARFVALHRRMEWPGSSHD